MTETRGAIQDLSSRRSVKDKACHSEVGVEKSQNLRIVRPHSCIHIAERIPQKDKTSLILRSVSTFALSMRFRCCLVGICVAILWCSLQGQADHEYDGVQAIREIKEGWLIIRLPDYVKKLAVLDSLLAFDDLTAKHRHALVEEQARTLNERAFMEQYYPVAFDSLYHFSKFAFIYMYQTRGFQSGEIPAWKSDGEMLDSVYRENYFFATLQGAVGKPFEFTTKNHMMIAYPFPNNIAKPGSIAIPLFAPPLPLWAASFAFDEGTSRRAYRHVSRVDHKLNAFYNKVEKKANKDMLLPD